jgi:tetratricopeptide (TPR) repeat protein
LTIAPEYAEGYQQRAFTLVRLGDRVQAQIDYNRFLALDPRAPDQVREEVTLFEQSGLASLGEAEAASYSYGGPIPASIVHAPPAMNPSPQQLADSRYFLAEDAFRCRDYDNAFKWATRSNDYMPQARTRGLMAQILLAQGDFHGAAAEARAATAMAPVMDWRTLYNYYGYTMPRLSRQFHSLQEFVRLNPSSADGRFLLGYEHLILGQAELAHAQLAIAAVMEPTDVLAINLLAKDGVEIVGGHRPLAQSVPMAEGIQVTRNPAPLPPGDVSPSAPSVARTNRSEVTR